MFAYMDFPYQVIIFTVRERAYYQYVFNGASEVQVTIDS